MQMGSNHSAIVALTTLLDDRSTEATKIDPLLNRTTALRYLAVAMALAHFDSIIGGMEQNYYLFDPTGAGIFEILTWDLNMAFGGFPGCSCGSAGQLFTTTNVSAGCGSNMIITTQLLRDTSAFATFMGAVDEFVNKAFKTSQCLPAFKNMAAKIRPSVELDPTRATTLQSFDLSVNTTADPLSDNSVLLTVPGGALALGRFLQVRPKVLAEQVAAFKNGASLPLNPQQGGGSKGGSCQSVVATHYGLAAAQLVAPTEVSNTCPSSQTSSTGKSASTTSGRSAVTASGESGMNATSGTTSGSCSWQLALVAQCFALYSFTSF